MNDDVILYFYNYLVNAYNVTKEELIKNSFDYVTKLFKYELEKQRNDIIRIQEKVKKLEEDREIYRNAITPKENYNVVKEGKNTGGRLNTVEMAIVEIININEKVIKLMAEKNSLEISANVFVGKLQELLDVLKNDTWKLVMQLTYIDGLNSTQVVNKYMPRNVPANIRKINHKARKKLAEEFEKYLKK